MFGGQNLNPATFKYQWKGDWKPHICFNRNDVVRHKGRSWYCNTDALFKNQTKGFLHEPGRGSEWNAYSYNTVNRGGWGPHRTYHEGDVVNYKGEWYACRIGGRGIHPVYDNGSTTSKWTKVIPTSRVNNTDKFIPHHANGNPLGWNKYRGAGQVVYNSAGQGAWLFDWDGNVRHYGSMGNGTGIYDGAGYTQRFATTHRVHDKLGVIPAFQDLDIIEHNKTPMTGQLECVQMFAGYSNNFYLLNNGGLYACGLNSESCLGVGDHTTAQRGMTVKVGMISNTQAWNAAITDTLRDAFIVKIAMVGDSQFGVTDRAPMALDSDGFVWTWGDSTKGQTGTGYSDATSSYTADIGIPKKLPRSIFGGNTIDDIFQVDGNNKLSDARFAIDTNGVLWGWGYNYQGILGSGEAQEMVRKPNPIIDCSKYGGLKKFCASGSNSYPFVLLLMENGSAFHLGSTSNLGHLFGQRVRSHNEYTPHGPIELAQFLYGNYRGRASELFELTDIFSDIQDVFTSSGQASVYNPIWFKDHNHDIRVAGYSGAHAPVLASLITEDGISASGDASRYHGSDAYHRPAFLDVGQINGLVEHVCQWGGKDGSTGDGALFLSEDGRLKVQRNEADGGAGGNKDPVGLGLSGGTGSGHDARASETGQSVYRLDEYGNKDEHQTLSPRGNGMAMYGTTHAFGAAGGTENQSTAVYVTISEDGTAGFYGQVTGTGGGIIEDASSNQDNISTSAKDDSHASVGRIRAV